MGFYHKLGNSYTLFLQQKNSITLVKILQLLKKKLNVYKNLILLVCNVSLVMLLFLKHPITYGTDCYLDSTQGNFRLS